MIMATTMQRTASPARWRSAIERAIAEGIEVREPIASRPTTDALRGQDGATIGNLHHTSVSGVIPPALSHRPRCV
jgi:hypothetical protein